MLLHVYTLLHVHTDADTWSDLKERSKIPPHSGTIRDVYDGEMYRKLSTFLSQPANVSLLLNTDGVSLFHSSTVSLWPIWLIVNELPSRNGNSAIYMSVLHM